MLLSFFKQSNLYYLKTMNRTHILTSAIFCGAIFQSASGAIDPAVEVLRHTPKPTSKPNAPHIIMIIADQHRGDALGCAGNKAIITPNLDRLASQGNLYTNAYSSTPSSTPARAGLLTGMSPWRHGMLGYGNVAEHYPCEMPQMLRDLGYMTMGIGKMHWRPQTALHGFHTTILDASNRRESQYFISDYHRWFYTQSFGTNPDATGLGWNDHAARAYALPERLHPTQWTGDVAIETIKNYASDAPLFLKVSFARPHSPYDPPQRVLSKYDGVEIPLPFHASWSNDVGAGVDPLEDKIAPFGNFGDNYAVNTRRHYYAAITFIDEQVGRIIEELKARGMYDNALICYVSDHGDMMGDHNHWRKTYAYEGSAAIPYIVKFPQQSSTAVKSGEKIENPVELRDLLPTFLALNNASQPAQMDGMPLTELVTKKEPKWRKYIDLEHSTCYSEHNYWSALTDGKIKYIWFFNDGSEQLFDLEKDPQEMNNLTADKRYASKLESLRSAMANHLAERGDEWSKGGAPQIRKSSLLYSPNYPNN